MEVVMLQTTCTQLQRSKETVQVQG
jgi:hypothetical protein